MSKSSSITDKIQESIAVKTALRNDSAIHAQLEAVVALLVDKLKGPQRVLLCGNGGSAADALHIAAEFSGRFYLNRKALPVEALNVNEAALTAISNDFGFAHLFARLLEAQAREKDVLWLFSTSGTSENIINAAIKAKEMGVDVISFTGQANSPLEALSKITIKIPSGDTPRIQECHLMLGHIICELVEKKLFDE